MKTITDFLLDNVYFVYFSFSILLIHYFTVVKEIKKRFFYFFSLFLFFYGFHYFFKSIFRLDLNYLDLLCELSLIISVYFYYLFLSDKLLKKKIYVNIVFFIIFVFYTINHSIIIRFMPFLLGTGCLLMLLVLRKIHPKKSAQRNILISFSILFLLAALTHYGEYFFSVENIEIIRIIISILLMGLIMFSVSGYILFKRKKGLKSHLFIFVYFISLIFILCTACFIVEKIRVHIKKIIKNEVHQVHTSISTRLEMEFDESRMLVETLAKTHRIRDFFKNKTSSNLKIVQELLDEYEDTINDSVIYIMDTTGKTIDSSNRDEKNSLIGKNYSFRPYFKNAVKDGYAKYLAVGITTGKRGFYSSSSIVDEHGNLLGIAVIKRNIDYIELYFQNYAGPIFLTDPDDIIFMSNYSETIYHPISNNITNERQTEILRSKKYPVIKNQSIFNGQKKNMEEVDFSGKNYFYTERPFNNGWKIIYLSSSLLLQNYITLFLITVLFIEILIILFFTTRQKERLYINKILESEDRYRSIFDNSPNLITILNKSFDILNYNQKTKMLIKGSEDSPENKNFTEFLGKDSSRLKQQILEIVSKGDIFSRELIFNTGLGRRIMFSLFSKLHDSTIMFIGIDITEERRMEKELFEEKERLLATLNSMEEFVISTNKDGRITLCNKAFSRLTGIPQNELIKKRLNNIITIKKDNTGINIIDKARKDKSSFTIEATIETNDNLFKAVCKLSPVFNNYGYISGFVMVFRDISKEQKIEEEMIELQKIESIGLFAAGIAHDFNNILTSILGNISMASRNAKDDPDIINLLKNAENACSNARELTNQLLDFTKDKDFKKSLIDTKELITKNANFSIRGYDSNIMLELAEDLWPIEADAGQINQVINNIIINAIQSSDKTVNLRIKANNHIIEESITFLRRPGKYVMISFKDDGPGIEKENIKKIFDPYFTTKKDGTGLGLATVRSILKKHDGFIDVFSEEGVGTEFIIYLPACTKNKIEKNPEKEEIGKKSAHNGSILVMDDEMDVREITGMMLNDMGYDVEFATKGEEVVDRLKNNERFDLIIIDLTIRGGLGGRETLKMIKNIDPDIKTIVSSGYSQNISGEDFKSQGFDGSLSKPFTYDEIYKAVESVLQQ